MTDKVKRVRVHITIDKELVDWVKHESEKSKKFRNLSHAVEWGLYTLRDRLTNNSARLK